LEGPREVETSRGSEMAVIFASMVAFMFAFSVAMPVMSVRTAAL